MSTPTKPMTPQRIREIAALLLEKARWSDVLAATSLSCAKDVEANPTLSETKPDQYRKAVDRYTADAKKCRDTAKELQDFSFTWKG